MASRGMVSKPTTSSLSKRRNSAIASIDERMGQRDIYDRYFKKTLRSGDKKVNKSVTGRPTQVASQNKTQLDEKKIDSFIKDVHIKLTAEMRPLLTDRSNNSSI